jgi:hypothetical protein
MHVIQHPRGRRVQKRMYLPSERMVVNGVGLGSGVRYVAGLGEVDGLFNIGKMFSRLIHITPRSFQLKNIAGAIGSAAMFTGSMGLSSLAPKLTGAHSTIAKDVGYGVMAAAAVAGAVVAAPVIGGALGIGGTAATGTGLTAIGTEAAGSSIIGAATGQVAAATSGGFLSTIGGAISSVGGGLMTAMQALPLIGQVFGGGQVQQQVDYGPAQPTADQIAAQAAYDAQVRAQQATMYQPGYTPNIPYVPGQYTGIPIAPTGEQPSMNTSYGDLRTPYTAITEDGEQVQVDPRTGEVVSPGISTPMIIAIGGITLLAGWYLMSDSKSTN